MVLAVKDDDQDHGPRDERPTLVEMTIEQIREQDAKAASQRTTPSQGVPTIDWGEVQKGIIERVSQSFIAQREDGGGPPQDPPPPPPPPPKKEFLGLTMIDWVRHSIRALIAIGILTFTVYKAITKGFEDRPTKTESKGMIEDKVKAHEHHGDHPDINKVIMDHDAQMRRMHDIQTTQTTILQEYGKDISEIKGDIKALERKTRK